MSDDATAPTPATPAAPTVTPPAAAFSSAFFSAAVASTGTDAKAGVPSPASAPSAPVPVSHLSTHAPAFTPKPVAPSPAALSLKAKPFVFKAQGPEFVPSASFPAAFGPAAAPFQPSGSNAQAFGYAPTTTTHTSFAPYTGPALNSYAAGSYAPAYPPASAPAPMMMNQFGQWTPVSSAAYSAQPQSYRPQPVIVPPPPVILSIKPLHQQLQQSQPQQLAYMPQLHSIQPGQQMQQQLQAKFGKSRKGSKQPPQPQFQLAPQELPQFPQPQQMRPPLPFAPAATPIGAAAAVAAAAPVESLSKSAQKKLAKQQHKQEQKMQKQQQKQQQPHGQADAALPLPSDPAMAASVSAPGSAAPAAAPATASCVRPLTARTPPMVRNRAAAASAAFATTGAAASSAAAPAPASSVAPARQPSPAAVAPPAPVPSAELTFVGYLGPPRSSQGMHATKRSMGQFINALCGREVFHAAAQHAPFAQHELRAMQRRDASQLGSAPQVDSKAQIRLADFEPLPMLGDEESLLNSPSLAPHPKSSSPPPPSVPSSRESPVSMDLLSEDVTLPVARFAEVQMAVDARNRIVHMHVAQPASVPAATAAGLSLGLDAPLGFERVDWMEELARMPLSVLQSMDESAFHHWLVAGTSQQLRSALVLFCTSHHIVIAHPAPQLQMEWIEALRLLAALKSRLFGAFAKDGSEATSADAAACAAMYRSLFSSLALTEPELKLLSRQSSALPLCFTPSVSFVVQPPAFLLGRAWDERKVLQFTDSFRAQLASICAHFGLIASTAATADVSPAACASMLLFTAGAIAPSGASSGGISTARFYKPSHRQNKNASPASDEKTADEESDASAPAQLHVTPLFFLHTQQPVVATDFAALFGESDDDDVFAPAKSSATNADPAALMSLRSTLERSIVVARAHIESLHASLPRDALSNASAFFSAERQLRCLQAVHSWIVDRSSPVASALDSTLLQSLHVDFQFSAARCEHASAVAKKIYQNAQQSAANARASAATPPASSPTPTAGAAGQELQPANQRTATQFYSAQAHRQRLETVVRLFHNLASAGADDAAPSSAPAPALSPTRAVGPAVAAFEAALRRDLESYWLQSHRGCDATSVFGHACVLPHGHSEQSLDNIAASSWPVEHAAVTHSLRLSCHCGSSLLKLAKEPFDVAALRIALTDRCCALVEPIGRQVFSGLLVDGSNGWNVFRPPAGYNPTTGFAHLSGFYSKAARTAFLPTIRLLLPEPHADRSVEVQMGLEFECPLGHRWIQPDTDDDSKDVASSPTAASAVGPVCRGFPRRDSFLFLPCLICRYLRHLQQKAASDAAADARQKRLHAEEKRGRAMLQREEKNNEQERSGSGLGSFAQPTVPSSTVRSHDRYAQLRRVWVVTPSSPLLTLNAHIKSTRPVPLQPGVATALQGASTTVTQQFDRLTLLRGESTGSFVAPASITHSLVQPTSVSSTAAPSLVHSRESDAADNFSPLSGATIPAGVPRPTLPPSSFVSIEVPFVLTRQGQCLSSGESKYCILQSHMMTPI